MPSGASAARRQVPGSARFQRVGFGILPKRTFSSAWSDHARLAYSTRQEVREGGTSGDSSAPVAGDDKAPKAVSTASARVQLPPGDWPKKAVLPPVGTAFETKNVGFISEAEPILGEDGATVDANFALTFTRHLGPLEVTGIAKTYPPRPLFESRKFTGSATATVGAQQFLSTFNLPVESGVNGRKDDGRVWLGFVRVVLVK